MRCSSSSGLLSPLSPRSRASTISCTASKCFACRADPRNRMRLRRPGAALELFALDGHAQLGQAVFEAAFGAAGIGAIKAITVPAGAEVAGVLDGDFAGERLVVDGDQAG